MERIRGNTQYTTLHRIIENILIAANPNPRSTKHTVPRYSACNAAAHAWSGASVERRGPWRV